MRSMTIRGKKPHIALFLVGLYAAGSVLAAEPYVSQTVTEYFPPRANYQNTNAAYGELPPVQSYNPNTGETVTLSPAPGAAPAPAQTPGSGIVPPAGTRAFEAVPLAFPDSSQRRERTPDEGRRQVTMPSIWPALLSVAGVCGLFCAALFIMKKYLPGHRQLFNHPAIEVLGRTHLDQKRFVSLIRVGKRVVVVGVSPDEMRALSEITDEAEVTEILDQARPKTEAGLTLFQKLFKKNVIETEEAEAREMAGLKAEELREQMLALKQRVAGIAPADERERERHFDAVG